MPKSYAKLVKELRDQRMQRTHRTATTGKVFRGLNVSQNIGRVSGSDIGESVEGVTTYPHLGSPSVRRK